MLELEEVLQLKAHAYDCLAQIQHWQRELQATEQRIAALLQQDGGQPQSETDDRSKGNE